MDKNKILGKIAVLETRNKFLSEDLYISVLPIFKEINSPSIKKLPESTQLDLNIKSLNNALTKAEELGIIFSEALIKELNKVVDLSSSEFIKEEDLIKLLKGDTIPTLAEVDEEIFNDDDFLADLFIENPEEQGEILKNLNEEQKVKLRSGDEDNLFATINKKFEANQDEEIALKVKEAMENSEKKYQNLLKRIALDEKAKKSSSIRRK